MKTRCPMRAVMKVVVIGRIPSLLVVLVVLGALGSFERAWHGMEIEL